MKRIVTPLAASMLALGLVACSKQGPDSSAASGAASDAQAASAASAPASGAVTVGLSISTLNNPFFVSQIGRAHV